MRLIPERRIFLYVGAMMGGVALAIIRRDLLASSVIAGIVTISYLFAVIAGLLPASERLARWQPVTVCMAWFLAGILSSVIHVMQLPSGLADRAARVEVTGMIQHVDGRFHGRLRMWLRVSETNRGPQDIATLNDGHIVRLSVRPDDMVPRAGETARVVARMVSAARTGASWRAGLFASGPRQRCDGQRLCHGLARRRSGREGGWRLGDTPFRLSAGACRPDCEQYDSAGRRHRRGIADR